jgi:hypothetical protein
MNLPTHITVTAPPGRLTPVHIDDGIEPGSAQLQVTSGHVCRVRYSHTIVRSIGRGDLIMCDANGAPVASVELAASPQEIDGVKKPIAAKPAAKGAK